MRDLYGRAVQIGSGQYSACRMVSVLNLSRLQYMQKHQRGKAETGDGHRKIGFSAGAAAEAVVMRQAELPHTESFFEPPVMFGVLLYGESAAVVGLVPVIEAGGDDRGSVHEDPHCAHPEGTDELGAPHGAGAHEPASASSASCWL